ncbi:MAG TPA: NAD(+)/NADH kinase [Anaerolineales bacterium]|jgi:NAD+ kinase|nr:NAD(+)/NADH kinase [Anaerolineales bacterium]
MSTKQIDTFRNIAVLAHPLIEEALGEAIKVVEYLRAKQANAEYGLLNDDTLRESILNRSFDLVITLGGDGTVLRAGHICAPVDVPILPVNMGSFGFLIEVSPAEWRDAIDRLFKGDFWYEDRMMLNATIWRGDECLDRLDVLNDVVIARANSLRPVHLSVSLDGQVVTTYVADALVVSTPTGSTAYALAAGGPILPPDLRNILLVPVAPHLSIDRAIVLAEGSTVSVRVLSDHGSVVSGDGQDALPLHQGDRVDVCASRDVTRLVRFQEVNYFYRNLVSLMDQNPSAGEAT